MTTQQKLADMAPKVIPYLSNDEADQVYNIFMTVDLPDKEEKSNVVIGVAKGEFKAPDNFDDGNEEMYAEMERYAMS